MSSKINILGIVKGHFSTLTHSNGKVLLSDVFTFALSPLILSGISMYAGFNLTDNLSSLLVNFGAIFTALLLSVLVLVYDQESKLNDKGKGTPLFASKKRILNELYYNISFSILLAITLVVSCFLHAVFKDCKTSVYDFFDIIYDVYLITPAVIFLIASLILNIVMIVKRMHSLLVCK